MKMIFFSKYSKFYLDFENRIKFPENVDGFEDNYVWTRDVRFCQLREEYIWSAVNLLKNGRKISDATEKHDTQLNFFDINGTLP